MGGRENDEEEKTVRTDEVLVDVWKMLEDISIRSLKDLLNKVLIERKMPKQWRKTFVVPIFKGKEDIQEC